MRMSRETLSRLSGQTGYRQEIIEKVSLLLSWLDRASSIDRLKGSFALKGGTAINLFFLEIPRLSVDIDINYIGSPTREELDRDRNGFENIIESVCHEESLSIRNKRDSEAATSYSLRYVSSLSSGGNLSIDVNYMMRVPLFEIETMDSRQLGSQIARRVPLVNKVEVFASKIAACFSRETSRDLYDVYLLDKQINTLDLEKLRLAFTVFGGMNRKNWLEIDEKSLRVNKNDLKKRLSPLLRGTLDKEELDTLASDIERSCQKVASYLLPLKDNEREFLRILNEKGEIRPEIITDDKELVDRIKKQPMLKWKALNVRQTLQG